MVDLIITDLAVFECNKAVGGLTLIELADGVSLDEVRAKTEASFTVHLPLQTA